MTSLGNALNPGEHDEAQAFVDAATQAAQMAQVRADTPGAFLWERLGTREDGLPVHLPMSVDADGQGPANDHEAHHLACWCGQQCPLTLTLTWAFRLGGAGRQVTTITTEKRGNQ